MTLIDWTINLHLQRINNQSFISDHRKFGCILKCFETCLVVIGSPIHFSKNFIYIYSVYFYFPCTKLVARLRGIHPAYAFSVTRPPNPSRHLTHHSLQSSSDSTALPAYIFIKRMGVAAHKSLFLHSLPAGAFSLSLHLALEPLNNGGLHAL